MTRSWDGAEDCIGANATVQQVRGGDDLSRADRGVGVRRLPTRYLQIKEPAGYGDVGGLEHMIVGSSSTPVVDLIITGRESCRKTAPRESEDALVCEGSGARNHPLAAGILCWLGRTTAA